MTWKPTEEMLKVFDMAADPLGFGDNDLTAALIAVQPLIAAETQAKGLEEAVVHLAAMFNDSTTAWERDYSRGFAAAFEALRSLIPKPPDESSA